MSHSCAVSAHHGPVGVMWKTVSEDCNLACDYCYYSRVSGKNGLKIHRIDSQLLEKFIKEYLVFTKGIASFVWQGGEPLLAGLDFFEEVVRLQTKYALPNTIIQNAVQTNATLMNDAFALLFKKYHFLLGISIDGPKEIHDVHRVTRTGSGSFDRVMQGVQILRNIEVDFNVLTVLHEGNITRAEDLMEFYEQEGFDFVQFIPGMNFHAQETNEPPTYLITPYQYGEFLCKVFDLWYRDGEPIMSIRFFDNVLSVYLHQEAELCTHQQICPEMLILEPNGDAYPCDFFMSDSYKLGNVGSNDLEDILENAAYKKFADMKPRLPGKCTSCEYLSLCHGGCPRNRLWDDRDNCVDADYFCEGYKRVYMYIHERMNHLAERIKGQRLREYIEAGGKLPERNAPCICGSGKKFKKCCEPLLYEEVSSRKGDTSTMSIGYCGEYSVLSRL